MGRTAEVVLLYYRTSIESRCEIVDFKSTGSEAIKPVQTLIGRYDLESELYNGEEN